MDLRSTVAAAVRRIIETETPPGEHFSVRGWALSKGLDVRFIDRLLKAEHSVTLDKIEEIAKACGVKPWMLLYEDFDPAAPPDRPITAEERDMLAKLRRLLGP